jgi:hypothetical protein
VEAEARLEYNLDSQEDVDLLILDSARLLLIAGHTDKAHELSRLIKGGYERTELLTLVAESVLGTNVADAMGLFDEAAKSAVTADEIWQQAELLCRIARIVARSGDQANAHLYLQKAVEIARRGEVGERMQDRVDSSSVIGEVADVYWDLGHKEEARALALSSADEGKRQSALRRLR